MISLLREKGGFRYFFYTNWGKEDTQIAAIEQGLELIHNKNCENTVNLHALETFIVKIAI